MFKLIGYSNTDQTPKGYILTRMTDPHGRPVAFVFAGSTSRKDGSDVFLDASLLGKSVNYKQMLDGYVYPLYYNTLFAVLRRKFNSALKLAQKNERGYWAKDKTTSGVTVNGKASLATIEPIWPKLWRRLETYLANNNDLGGFLNWLDQDNERVVIINTTDETGLANLVQVSGNKVSLSQKPENLMIITEINRG
jgi:hypothetical protein